MQGCGILTSPNAFPDGARDSLEVVRIVTVLGRRGSSRTLRVVHKGVQCEEIGKEIQAEEGEIFRGIGADVGEGR